jgi:hypothetical protein
MQRQYWKPGLFLNYKLEVCQQSPYVIQQIWSLGPQAPFEYFESDRRNVSEIGVAEVMNSLLKGLSTAQIKVPDSQSDNERTKKSKAGRLISEISRRIARAECDEAMMDKNL